MTADEVATLIKGLTTLVGAIGVIVGVIVKGRAHRNREMSRVMHMKLEDRKHEREATAPLQLEKQRAQMANEAELMALLRKQTARVDRLYEELSEERDKRKEAEEKLASIEKNQSKDRKRLDSNEHDLRAIHQKLRATTPPPADAPEYRDTTYLITRGDDK